MSIIAVLHPGQMGAAVGAALVAAGHTVYWNPAGRGSGTRRRAAAAGLVAGDDVRDCDVVLSICPPGVALEVARRYAGYTGLYVDANAVSPGTAAAVADVVRASGAAYVDGGIVGPPPLRPGTTRLFLSGGRAADVAAVFATSCVETVLLDGEFTASALKMTYAAWTKITTALLIGVHQAAVELEVEDALIAEWARSQPGLAERHVSARNTATAKGWRWADEMRQIAETFAAVEQPRGFGEAAAAIFDSFPRPADD